MPMASPRMDPLHYLTFELLRKVVTGTHPRVSRCRGADRRRAGRRAPLSIVTIQMPRCRIEKIPPRYSAHWLLYVRTDPPCAKSIYNQNFALVRRYGRATCIHQDIPAYPATCAASVASWHAFMAFVTCRIPCRPASSLPLNRCTWCASRRRSCGATPPKPTAHCASTCGKAIWNRRKRLSSEQGRTPGLFSSWSSLRVLDSRSRIKYGTSFAGMTPLWSCRRRRASSLLHGNHDLSWRICWPGRGEFWKTEWP